MKYEFLDCDLQSACDFIKRYEGLELTAYRCPAGVWTIGYGHTGKDVCSGMTITQDEANSLLLHDVECVVLALAKHVKVQVTEGQFVALVSLAFNVGVNCVVCQCPKLMNALNAGDEEECARQFLDITKSNGKVLPGLVSRRKAESELFLS